MTEKKVIKRTGEAIPFQPMKIYEAIMKAMRQGSGIIREDVAGKIAEEIREEAKDVITIAEIEELVYKKLIHYKQALTARSYEAYRSVRAYQRENLSIDEKIMGIVRGFNQDVIKENANKNARIASTQRDLIAGEFSKDYCDRKLLPATIVRAEKEGAIHFHDKDYFIQPIFNCCLVDLKDMLEKGTVINGKLIEKPKSFQTACTVATQIVQQVANGQYGGQTITLSHLAPYVQVSRRKHRRMVAEEGRDFKVTYTEEQIRQIAEKRLRKEIRDGVQTMQYQINTFSTSNGQAPFLTVFMYLEEEPQYKEETALLVEEFLKLRYKGMKNEAGAYITPAFPKLIYVLDEDNIHADSPYRYLTDLAIRTVARRMMPDFISARKMRETHDGEVFPPMGCRAFLSPWKDEKGQYKWYGRFNQGVVTLNLVDAGLSANKDMESFWQILDNRLELVKQALILRHDALRGVPSDISPIHWQYGAISRLGKHESFEHLLLEGYSTITLGYIGLHETIMSLLGKSLTSAEGEKLGLAIIQHLKDTTVRWTEETGLGFALYGTPSESTTYTLAKKTRDKFGVIAGITDKEYLTNSYHVNVCEEIDAFRKLAFESAFQVISSGGCISYVEVPNLTHNHKALDTLVRFMYDNIQYAEINTKSDYCQKCGHSGEILLDDGLSWYCPQCGNRDEETMNVCRRTCGYLGDNFWNKGRTQEIKDRVLHLDARVEVMVDELRADPQQ